MVVGIPRSPGFIISACSYTCANLSGRLEAVIELFNLCEGLDVQAIDEVKHINVVRGDRHICTFYYAQDNYSIAASAYENCIASDALVILGASESYYRLHGPVVVTGPVINGRLTDMSNDTIELLRESLSAVAV